MTRAIPLRVELYELAGDSIKGALVLQQVKWICEHGSSGWCSKSAKAISRDDFKGMISPRSVRRHLRDLHKKGVLERQPAIEGQHFSYRIAGQNGQPAGQNGQPAGQNGQPAGQNGQPAGQNGRPPYIRTPAQDVLEKERKEEIIRERGETPAGDPAPPSSKNIELTEEEIEIDAILEAHGYTEATEETARHLWRVVKKVHPDPEYYLEIRITEMANRGRPLSDLLRYIPQDAIHDRPHPPALPSSTTSPDSVDPAPDPEPPECLPNTDRVASTAWIFARARLDREVSEQARQHLKKLEPAGFDDHGRMVIWSPDAFATVWCHDQYRDLIENAVADTCDGREIYWHLEGAQ